MRFPSCALITIIALWALSGDSVARAANCAKGSGDFCAGACPVMLAWPWDGAWCSGGARGTGGAGFHKEGRCGWVGRGDFVGAYACILGNITIPIAGCDVSIADIGGGFNCIKGKVEAELRSRLSMNIAGCQVSIGDIPGGFNCLKGKIESELKSRLAINIFGCNVSIADPAGSFNCLKDKASEELKKGIGGLLALIEKAKPILDCTGISDVVDLTTRFFRDPGGTIKGTWDRVVGFVKTIGAGIAANATELGMEAIKLVTGTNISHQVLDKVMALMWSTGEEMAKFSGPARCLMGFLKENRSTVEGPARAVVQGVIDLIPTISNLAQDLLAKAGAAILDKVLPKLLGEDRTKRLKEFFEKAFGPAALQDEAGRRLNAAIQAIRTRAPNAKTLWQNAKALIHGTTGDFGLRRLAGQLQILVEQAAVYVIDELGVELAKWLVRAVDTAIPNLFNRILDGVCGLIPEAGAAACTFTIALVGRTTWNTIGQELLLTILKPIIQNTLGLVAKKVSQLVIRQVADRINAKWTGALDAAVAGNTGAQWASLVVSPIVDFFFRVIQKWALPNLQRSVTFNAKVAELGDVALALAFGQKPPPAKAEPKIPASAMVPDRVKRPMGQSRGKVGAGGRSSGGVVAKGAWSNYGAQLIHCGIKGKPGYATIAGCRIKSGPGCTGAVEGQCSFPRERARELCAAHGRCRAVTCARGASTCQARDSSEARAFFPADTHDSQVLLLWRRVDEQLIHCGVKGRPDYGTPAGCRIKDGPGCDQSIGQCSFPKDRARELCAAHPRCRGYTCNAGRNDCQARDADEARTLVRNKAYTSHTAQ